MTGFTDEKHDLAHWGKAIRDEAPCGEDLSLDSEFECLSDEIGKDKSLHGDQKTDWVVVYSLANSLLARSKDLWVFAYGTIAVYHVKSVRDCIYCINSLTELLSTQWQSLHPALKRPKRRVAPLKWMCDKFQSIADNTAFLNLSPTDLGALNDAFIGLQKKIDLLLPDNDLSFRNVLRAQFGGGQGGAPSLPEKLNTATAAKPPLSASGPPPRPVPLQTALEDIGKRSLIPPAVLPQLIRTVNDNARQIGDHLLAVNKEDGRAYQLHRIVWETLLQLPPSDSNGVTQLACPVPPDMIDIFAAGVKDKRYAEMLPQIERAASNAPFWLDGQHMIVNCLEGLGAELPAFSVKHSLAQLVKRFPDIPSLKFRDGRSFASPKTATWINSFLPVIFGNGSFGVKGRAVFGDAAQNDEARLLQDAIARLLENDFTAGLDVLGNVPPGKSRAFLRHCLLKAKYCSAAGQPIAARHLLKSLIDKLKCWDLLEWEPELTADAVSLLLSLSPRQEESDEELRSLLHFISLETAVSEKHA